MVRRWSVAVFQSGVHHSIASQSISPVRAVSAVMTRATSSASHQPVAVGPDETPILLKSARTAATV
jgi:hypothetical protein